MMTGLLFTVCMAENTNRKKCDCCVKVPWESASYSYVDMAVIYSVQD